LFAEKLGLEVSGKYSELIATPDKAKEIVLKVS
jgi:hypothetical protein